MKRLVLALGLLTSACAPEGGKPNVPTSTPTVPVYAFGLVACAVPVATEAPCPKPIANAVISIHTSGGYAPKTANANGYALFASSLPFSDVAIKAEGFVDFAVGIEPPKITGKNLSFSLTPIRKPVSAGESGRIHVDGLVFRREDRSIFQWRGCTEFLAFKRFREEPDHAALRAVLEERVAAGCNVFRVFGMVDSFAKFRPDGDGYYRDLGAFADFLASELGARFEFVAFADAQIVMPDYGDERVYLEKVTGVLTSKPNAFLEVANEPFKNLPDGRARAQDLGRAIVGRGVPVASGNYDIPDCAATLPHLDYVTIHNERKPDWPRTARAIAEVRDGFGWGANCTGDPFAGVKAPVVGDEPMGFAEVVSGSRSTSVDDAAYFAATCALMGAGCTYHSTDGITSTPWGPVQKATATAFFDALKWVPVDAQLAPYMRGGTDPGCHWVGDSIAEHDDERELRSFAKIVNGQAWMVQIRTTRDVVRPCGGWKVDGVLRRGLVHLRQ
jgi:hypothetical protein